MTITVEFKGFNDMMEFARNLAGNTDQDSLKALAAGEDVLRPNETGKQLVTRHEPEEEQSGQTQEEVTESREEQQEPAVEYTLVQVREKLAELQKAGKRAQVQELIGSFGVKKLTEVPEKSYPELMQKAGEL